MLRGAGEHPGGSMQGEEGTAGSVVQPGQVPPAGARHLSGGEPAVSSSSSIDPRKVQGLLLPKTAITLSSGWGAAVGGAGAAHACTHTESHARACTHAHIHMHPCMHNAHTCMHTHKHTYTCTMHTHSHMHTCAHARTHVHTHTLLDCESSKSGGCVVSLCTSFYLFLGGW